MVVLQGPDYERVYAAGGNDFVIRTEGQTPDSAVLVRMKFILKLNAIYVPDLDEAILAACCQHRAAGVALLLGAPLERGNRALKGVKKLDRRWFVWLPQADEIVCGATG